MLSKYIRLSQSNLRTDDGGKCAQVKHGQHIKELSTGDSNHLRPLQLKQEALIKGCKGPLNWQHIVNAVKHEMFPKLGAAIDACADDLADLSKETVIRLIERLKKKSALSHREVQYIRDLVKRARQFSWSAQPQIES